MQGQLLIKLLQPPWLILSDVPLFLVSTPSLEDPPVSPAPYAVPSGAGSPATQ